MDQSGNLNLLFKTLQKYKSKLFSFNRKNKELFFKISRHTLNLTENNLKGLKGISEEKIDQFEPINLKFNNINLLFKNGLINLTEHFSLKEFENNELVKSIDKIRLEDKKYQREFGISGAWFLGPFLIWRIPGTTSLFDVMITPIFKIPIDIEKKKGHNEFTLKLETTDFLVNPSLIEAIKSYYSIEISENYDCEEISQALEMFSEELMKIEHLTINRIEGREKLPEIPVKSRRKLGEDGELLRDENGKIIREEVNAEEALSDADLSLYKRITTKEFLIVDWWCVEQFSASKLALMQDYEKVLNSEGEHPIIRELFHGHSSQNSGGSGNSFKELDQYKESTNYFVVDTDSSQHRAVDKVSKERAVVIQGPPGTGKSQTICNIIANLLAKGKKVLFVAEKRAALDVVANRLNQSQLGEQFVLLHSSELNRTELYNQFLELASAELDEEVQQDWESTSNELDSLKKEIGLYYEALVSEHEVSGLTNSAIFMMYSKVINNDIDYKVGKMFSHISSKNHQSLVSNLRQADDLAKQIETYTEHPWLWKNDNIIYSNKLKHEIEGFETDVVSISNEVLILIEKINNDYRIEVTEQNAKLLKGSVSELLGGKKIDSNWSKAFTNMDAFNFNSSDTTHLRLKELNDIIKNCGEEYVKVKKDTEDNIISSLDDYFKISRSFKDIFSSEFWKMRKLKNQVLNEPTFKVNTETFNKFRKFKASKLELIEIFNKLGYSKINEIKMLDDFIEFSDKSSEIYNEAREIMFRVKTFHELAPKVQLFRSENIDKDYEALKILGEMLDSLIIELTKFFEVKNQVDNYFQRPFESNSIISGFPPFFKNLKAKINDLIDLDKIDQLLIKIESEFCVSDLKEFFISMNKEKKKDWVTSITESVVSVWYDDVVVQFQNFRGYEKVLFERKIEKLNELISQHKLLAQSEVKNTYVRNFEKGNGDSVALKMLEKEANKKRRVKSPREVMESGGADLMMKLKPCWLMSPLSISQILPNELGLFDTIIFDEASQVRVEDAIPSIFRAKSLVVVGDDKQMPPTNFFSYDEPDDDDEDEIEIAESILDLALMVYPSEMLEWHYRSRKEALIAFSNRAFYRGRLIAVPNPEGFADSNAISFRRIQDAYFSSNSGNKVEAKEVVNFIAKLVKENPNRSLGVIALGMSQQKAIEEAIDELRAKDSDFDKAYEICSNLMENDGYVGMFIKNLENVQGDERDEIILSVGYAPPGPGKKIRQNFGPLGKKGGGRRLNVAITRAKEKMTIFCSFDPSSIGTDEASYSSNPDKTTFGRYLNYVKAVFEENFETAKSILDLFPVGGVVCNRKFSNFSRDVKNEVEKLGFTVATEVGSSGFYIDLALEHPSVPGSYFLGIECDGAVFHSSDYARDRDKIRQDLLEQRGWKIIRVWSQDWVKNRESEIAKIESTIKKLLQINNAA